MPRARCGIAALLAMPMLSGCIDELHIGSGDDCEARIRYQGVIYAAHESINQAAPKGGKLGMGEVVDCGDVDSAPTVDQVAVRSVRGVPTSVAVAVGSGKWRAIYAAEDIAQAEWPRVLHTH